MKYLIKSAMSKTVSDSGLSIELAIQTASKSGDESLKQVLISFLIGETDGDPKVF